VDDLGNFRLDLDWHSLRQPFDSERRSAHRFRSFPGAHFSSEPIDFGRSGDRAIAVSILGVFPVIVLTFRDGLMRACFDIGLLTGSRCDAFPIPPATAAPATPPPPPSPLPTLVTGLLST
jgi:hypothetical protein